MANNRFAVAIVANDLTDKGVKAALKRLNSLPTAASKANKAALDRFERSTGRSGRSVLRTFGVMEQASARVFGSQSLTGGIASKLSAIRGVAASAGEGLGAAAAEGGIMTTALAGVGIAAGVTVGVLAGVAFAGYKVADSWSSAGASLGRLSQLLGVATRDLQAFRGAGERVGVDAGTTDGAMASIAQTTHDAYYGRNNNALALMKRLNIDFTKKADGTLDYSAITMQLADAVKRQKDPMTAKAVTDVFGATAALPVLRQGSTTIKAEMADYDKTGAEYSDADVKDATRVQRKIVLGKQALGKGAFAAERYATSASEPLIGKAVDGARSIADSSFGSVVKGQLAPAAGKIDAAADKMLSAAAQLVEGRAGAAEMPPRVSRDINWQTPAMPRAGSYGSPAMPQPDEYGAPAMPRAGTYAAPRMPGRQTWPAPVMPRVKAASPVARNSDAAVETQAWQGRFSTVPPQPRAPWSGESGLLIRRGGVAAANRDASGNPGGGRFSNRAIEAYARQAQRPFQILRGLGLPEIQAAGLAASIAAESHGDHRSQQPNGTGYGLAQWEPPRQALFKAWAGHDIRASTEAEQYRFIVHELTEGKERGAWRKLLAVKDAGDAAEVATRFYERPKFADRDAADRAEIARRLMQSKPAPPTLTPSKSQSAKEGDGLAGLLERYFGGVPPKPAPAAVVVHRHDIRIEREGGVTVSSRTEGQAGVAIHRSMTN